MIRSVPAVFGSALAGAALLLLAAACSGPAGASGGGSSGRPAPPAASEEEEAAPVRRTVQGFRIQLLITEDKAAADARVEEALRWWQAVPRAERPPHMKADEPPLGIAWQQPYYRVRLGAFASRAEARRALALAQKRFPEAFVVLDTVTIVR